MAGKVVPASPLKGGDNSSTALVVKGEEKKHKKKKPAAERKSYFELQEEAQARCEHRLAAVCGGMPAYACMMGLCVCACACVRVCARAVCVLHLRGPLHRHALV